MGCWNETCMLTHLPILEGEDIACVLFCTAALFSLFVTLL